MKRITMTLVVVALCGCPEPMPVYKPLTSMTVAELEADIVSHHEAWTAVKLQPAGNNADTGTATTQDGQSLPLKVTCTSDTLRAFWENPDGSGSGEVGYKLPREVVESWRAEPRE
jgi:hypothetical protein